MKTLLVMTLITISTLGAAVIHAAYSYDPLTNPALEAAKKSVIKILKGNGVCSATVVNAQQVITAAHCMPTQEETYLALAQQRPVIYSYGSLIALSPQSVWPSIDAAVLKGSLSGLPATTDVDYTEGLIYTVDKAVLCGYPLVSTQLRCVVAKRVGRHFFGVLYDTSAIPGQSGGGVFTLEGKLIGIIQSVSEKGLTKVGSTVGLNYQMPN